MKTLIQYPAGKNTESYRIPDGVKRIGSYAFAKEYKDPIHLKKVEFPNGLLEIGKETFKNCEIENVELPDSVVMIDEGCFEFCRNIKHLKLSNSLETISDYAFMECINITSLTIPPSVKHIGTSAFISLSLNSVYIPKTVETIGYHAFALKNVHEVHIRYDNPNVLEKDPIFISKEMCDLYVPIGSKYAYSIHPFFKDYRTIITEDSNYPHPR